MLCHCILCKSPICPTQSFYTDPTRMSFELVNLGYPMKIPTIAPIMIIHMTIHAHAAHKRPAMLPIPLSSKAMIANQTS